MDNKNIVVVQVPLANVRSNASKKDDNNILKTVKKNHEMEVVKVNKKWIETTEGFIMKHLVKEKEITNE